MMKNRWMYQWVAVLVFSLISLQTTFAQDDKSRLLLPGPDGVVISTYKLLSASDDNQKAAALTNQAIIVNKKLVGEKKFRKIATVSFPKSANEMAEKVGEKSLASILKRLKANNAEEAYAILRQYGVDTLGFLMFSPKLQEAFGLFYTDESWEKGQKAVYRFDKIVQGEVTKNIYSESVNGKYVKYRLKFSLDDFRVSKDFAMAGWSAMITSDTRKPTYAQLFAYNQDENSFLPYDRAILFRKSADSVSVTFSREVNKGTRLAWYIRPLDRAGNLGMPSDTMYGVSIDKTKIASIKGLSVTDTTDGLLLQWESLPNEAIYSAIQILKSRQVGSDYVVLDTVSARSTSYLDEQVISGAAYFYKVRPLLLNIPGVAPRLFAEASGYRAVNDSIAPAAPQGLQVNPGEDGIHLSWIPNSELNLFAYYVLRGTTPNNMTIVSGPVKDNSYIDSSYDDHYSGQYIYALQVMNQGQIRSDTSAVASINVRQPIAVTPPGGIQGRRVPEGISLSWENTRENNSKIIGYVLYRKKTGTDKYKLLLSDIIELPFFTDTVISLGVSYDYAVASMDAWGHKSILSPLVTVAINSDRYLSPPKDIALRNLSEGIEVSWPVPYDAGNRQYVIYRKAENADQFKRIATVKPTGVFMDKAAQKNTLYQYAVAVKVNTVEGNRSTAYLIRRK